MYLRACALLQEVKEARQRYETRLVEVDSGRKQEYEYKLIEGLSQMRGQNEEQIRLYKDNMESTYQTRVGRLPSLLLSVDTTIAVTPLSVWVGGWDGDGHTGPMTSP